MLGLKPAVVALIGTAVITTANVVFFGEQSVVEIVKTVEFYKTIVIFGIALVLILKKIHPIKVILSSALLGVLLGFI